MTDLISRQAAIAEAYNVVVDGSVFKVVQVETLYELPTIDPKKGKWINDRGLYRCSACDNLWTSWWAVVVPEERMCKEMKYCPNCGAMMERSEK